MKQINTEESWYYLCGKKKNAIKFFILDILYVRDTLEFRLFIIMQNIFVSF